MARRDESEFETGGYGRDDLYLFEDLDEPAGRGAWGEALLGLAALALVAATGWGLLFPSAPMMADLPVDRIETHGLLHPAAAGSAPRAAN
jgi:hypothetical protein